MYTVIISRRAVLKMAAVRNLVFVFQVIISIYGGVSAIDTSSIIDGEIEERECYGTNNGMGYSGTYQLHYERMKQRYTGCTYVNGNLEITNLWDPKVKYDLSFLKRIRYVSGYVLLALTLIDEISMDSLEIIRGNQTNALGGDHYSLIVALTYSERHTDEGLIRLHMPRLQEITNGKVLFTGNPKLGYINTIDWEPILRGRYEDVVFNNNPFNETASPNDTSICPDGMRWGDEPYLCQEVYSYLICHEDCNGRCYGERDDECCHDTCAVGCIGPSNMDCVICKDYVYEGGCEGFCPAMTYPSAQNCVKYDKMD